MYCRVMLPLFLEEKVFSSVDFSPYLPLGPAERERGGIWREGNSQTTWGKRRMKKLLFPSLLFRSSWRWWVVTLGQSKRRKVCVRLAFFSPFSSLFVDQIFWEIVAFAGWDGRLLPSPLIKPKIIPLPFEHKGIKKGEDEEEEGGGVLLSTIYQSGKEGGGAEKKKFA